MKKLLQRLFPQHIRLKLILVYLIVGMLPFTVFAVYSWQNTRALSIRRETESLHNSLDQALGSVNATLETYTAMCNYIFNDPSLLSALNRRYYDRYYDMHEVYSKIISPSLIAYYALYPSLERITIYSACDIHPYGNYVSPLKRLAEDEPFFAGHPVSFAPQWVAPELSANGQLICARRIGVSSTYPYENVLYLAIDPDAVFRPLYGISTHPYAILVRSGGDSFFLCDTLFGDSEPDPEAILRGDLPGMSTIRSSLQSTGWEICFVSSLDSLVGAANRSIMTTYALSWALLLLLGILVICFISSLTRPIERLAGNMRAFGRGDMSVTVPVSRSDEIGQLERSFNDMAAHIRELIEVTYNNELREREYQQRLLQAQINPHFLYNSLSIINSKAILAEQPEISDMAMQLSRFYRSALNHGRQITTIQGELDNIHAYVNLQLMLGSNRFTPVYDVDNSVSGVHIPNFILQPIVENAIEHGLRCSLKPDRTLTIRVLREDGDVVFIIHDNGAGMDEATLNSLYDEKTEGYGIRNVDDRLRLTYGDRYSMRIVSELGVSTTATLHLPADFLSDTRELSNIVQNR